MVDKAQTSIILSVIHHRQDPLESKFKNLFELATKTVHISVLSRLSRCWETYVFSNAQNDYCPLLFRQKFTLYILMDTTKFPVLTEFITTRLNDGKC
jgi:hypothetical protein